jgi:hypothetical protein
MESKSLLSAAKAATIARRNRKRIAVLESLNLPPSLRFEPFSADFTMARS